MIFASEKDAKDLSTSNKQINDNRASVSPYKNHRDVIIGPSDVGKTYYMLKILITNSNRRPMQIITRSPNQHPNYKTSIDFIPTDK